MLTDLFLRVAFTGSEWVLWVLLLISFISVATIVEKIVYLRRTRVDGDKLADNLEKHLKAGDLRGAYDLVYGEEAIECEVVAAGLAAISRGAEACAEAMQSVKARLKPIVEARLAILGTIGSNAPYIGLLGTVLGIIKAAHDLTADTTATAGAANPNAVMAGVFEALIATAFGLFVAIPAVVAYNVLQRRVRHVMAQTDSLAHLILASLRYERRPLATGAQSQPPQPSMQ
jgi:biopolymer transport protein ExbB/TolQ